MAGPVDYRQLQAPEQVNTGLPNNEAAARAEELSGAFKDMEGISGNVLTKAYTQTGALAGAAAGATGNPNYKQGLERFTAYGQAFNNAATGAYAIQAEAQADDAAARLRVQANNNPDTFRTTYTAIRDSVLKNAPALAVPMLTEVYNQRLAEGLAAVSGDQALEMKRTQAATYEVGIQRQTSRVALLEGSANPRDQAQALDEQVKLTQLIDGGVNSGLYSTAEAESMHIAAAREITAQVFSTQVDRELANPNGDVMAVLQRFRAAHIANLSNPNQPPILSEPEYQKLMQDATTKIREQRILQMLYRTQGSTAEEEKFKTGDAQYTELLFSGKLTDAALASAVKNGDLRPSTARTLHNALEGGDNAKSNPRLLFDIQNSPDFLDLTPSSVARDVGPGGISYKDAARLVQEAQKRRDSWEGTQASKQAIESIGAALKVPPGTPLFSLTPEQRTAFVHAKQEYEQLMNATDPAKRNGAAMSVAQTVIKHSEMREAEANARMYMQGRQSYIHSHGPGSAAPDDATVYAAAMKQFDDEIARAQAAAKGQ